APSDAQRKPRHWRQAPDSRLMDPHAVIAPNDAHAALLRRIATTSARMSTTISPAATDPTTSATGVGGVDERTAAGAGPNAALAVPAATTIWPSPWLVPLSAMIDVTWHDVRTHLTSTKPAPPSVPTSRSPTAPPARASSIPPKARRLSVPGCRLPGVARSA